MSRNSAESKSIHRRVNCVVRDEFLNCDRVNKCVICDCDVVELRVVVE